MTINIDTTAFIYNCTGDVCVGDTILFTEAVFGGSFRKPTFLGERQIVAKVVKDSYGREKQQHTFSIEIIASDGYDPLTPGKKTTRKGRNIYRNKTARLPWADEAARHGALAEKHQRGEEARAEREIRKNEMGYF